MDLEKVVEYLKELQEEEGKKYIGYLFSSEHKAELFEEGIERLDKDAYHAGLIDLDESFLNNPVKFIEEEVGGPTHDYDSMAIVEKAYRDIRTRLRVNSFSPQEIIGSVSLSEDHTFDENEQAFISIPSDLTK
jgi:YHS domain-containing protein